MTADRRLRQRLAALPSVHILLQTQAARALCERYPRPHVVNAIRDALQQTREAMRSSSSDSPGTLASPEALMQKAAARLAGTAPAPAPAINASGILFHDALNHTPLSAAAHEAMTAAQTPSIPTGAPETGVEPLLCRITGADDALAVHSPAAALWLALDTFGRGKTVVVSRGHLGTLDGQTRLLDLLERCGARVIEVGATNKTHLKDYAAVLDETTGAVCVVRPATYAMQGFTHHPPLDEVVCLGDASGTPVVYHLGHAPLTPVSTETWRSAVSVRDAAQAGAAVILFRGDGLVGGPACGLAVGWKTGIERMRRHPLFGMVSASPAVIAGMAAALHGYDPRNPLSSHPAGWMLTDAVQAVEDRARRLSYRCRATLTDYGAFDVVETTAYLTSPRLPDDALPSRAVRVRPARMNGRTLADLLRRQSPPVLCAAHEDAVSFDLRGVSDPQIDPLCSLLQAVFKNACVNT